MKGFILLKVAMIFTLLSTCQKADLSDIENLRANEIAAIGHGGLGFPSPEVNLPSNSFEGITKAVEGYQAEGIEVDVQLSADGILFLYHDSRLQTLTDCLGCVYQYNAAELEACKYVSGFNTQFFNDQKLVRLDKVLEHFSLRVPKPYVFLDLKTSLDCPHAFEYSDFETSFINSLKTIFANYNCQDWVIIESGELSLLEKLKNEIPEAKLNYFCELDRADVEEAMEYGFFGLSANFDQASEEEIRAAHDQGLFVTLGILKIRRDAIDMIEKSPDFIYTDNIPLLQSILK